MKKGHDQNQGLERTIEANRKNLFLPKLYQKKNDIRDSITNDDNLNNIQRLFICTQLI